VAKKKVVTKTPAVKKRAAKKKVVQGKRKTKISVSSKPRPRKRRNKKTMTATDSSEASVDSSSSKKPAETREFKIQLPDGVVLDFSCDSKKLQQFAMEWSYIVENRRRFLNSDKAREDVTERLRANLEGIGISSADLAQIAKSKIVEIGIPWASEREGWELRVLPWESILSVATRAAHQTRDLIVVRHLRVPQRQSHSAAGIKPLIVLSSPGVFEEYVDFEKEENFVRVNLGATPECVVRSPSSQSLRDLIEERQPNLIHFSGVDTHQGASFLKSDAAQAQQRDGVYIAKDDGDYRVIDDYRTIDAEEFAKIVNSGSKPLDLVVINGYHSAARIAALSVAHGADAAIGIQDKIDDAAFESFLANFYLALSRLGGDTAQAFQISIAELRKTWPNLDGDIVLWMATSVFTSPLGDPVQGERTSKVAAQLAVERREIIRIRHQEGETLQDILTVLVKPTPRINYALLHNDEKIFKNFSLQLSRPGILQNVHVEVSLQIGSDAFPYRQNIDIVDSPMDISDDIRVPLTWDYVQGMRESVRSVIYVKVCRGDTTLHEVTYPIIIDPVGEWLDKPDQWQWLPSFVLPRDNAVEEIIRRAQRYLCALTDDSGAGFDGYQGVDPSSSNPGESVDLQVQAIWAALAFENRINYINPPPSYAEFSQRVRTPTQIWDARHGTCIDLALLLAACLEYIDIFPVLILLNGHAFLGYWRTEEAYASFAEPVLDVSSDEQITDSRVSDNQDRNWMFGPMVYDEIVNRINADGLYPVECVALTQQTGFWAAIDQGFENLAEEHKDEFAALVDVRRARLHQITPLPL
jgi:hypothetical protein